MLSDIETLIGTLIPVFLIAVWIVQNFKSGYAVLYGMKFERQTRPIGSWITQTILIVLLLIFVSIFLLFNIEV